MLDKSAANLKKGLSLAPIDLAAFAEARKIQMAFNIRMGLPKMEALWNDLSRTQAERWPAQERQR